MNAWQCKMWFGHGSRSSDLTKMTLKATVKGKKRGRQKRLNDIIKEWIGMKFASSKADNRTRWEGIIAMSAMLPRRPSKVMGWN